MGDNLLRLRDVFSEAAGSYRVIIPSDGFFSVLTLILFKNFQAPLSHKMFLPENTTVTSFLASWLCRHQHDIWKVSQPFQNVNIWPRAAEAKKPSLPEAGTTLDFMYHHPATPGRKDLGLLSFQSSCVCSFSLQEFAALLACAGRRGLVQRRWRGTQPLTREDHQILLTWI